MCNYRIISISKTEIGDDTYCVLVKNDDTLDQKYLQLSPHAVTSAKGFQINENGEAINPFALFLLEQSPAKELRFWDIGDEVFICLES